MAAVLDNVLGERQPLVRSAFQVRDKLKKVGDHRVIDPLFTPPDPQIELHRQGCAAFGERRLIGKGHSVAIGQRRAANDIASKEIRLVKECIEREQAAIRSGRQELCGQSSPDIRVQSEE